MSLPLSNRPSGTVAAAMTTGNSAAGGNAFDTIGTGVTYGAERARLGQHALCTQDGTAASQMMQWGSTSTGTLLSGSTVWIREYREISALPAANMQIQQLRHSINGGCAGVRINTTGTVSVVGSAGTALATSAETVPVGTLMRIETKVVLGATTTGSVETWWWWATGSNYTGPDGKDDVCNLHVVATGVDTRGDATHVNIGLVTSSTNNAHKVWDMHAAATRPPLRYPSSYRRVSGVWRPA